MTPVQKAKRLGTSGLHIATVLLFTLFTACPFYWMLITTFKRTSDLMTRENNPFLFNEPPTLEHLRVLFFETVYGKWLWNTAWVGAIVVVITLLLAVPAGYALARRTGRWGEQLGIGIFLAYLVPPTLLFIPLSRVIADLGLQDSLWSLVLVYPSFTIPVAGILTVVIFTFTLVTQEFVYALTFITTASQYTVSVGVPTFLVHGDVYFWGSLMAGCFIASVPIAILYNFFVDRFIAGFTVGAIK